jgi:hypothetical protein
VELEGDDGAVSNQRGWWFCKDRFYRANIAVTQYEGAEVAFDLIASTIHDQVGYWLITYPWVRDIP